MVDENLNVLDDELPMVRNEENFVGKLKW
jgi:hypothetical protein